MLTSTSAGALIKLPYPTQTIIDAIAATSQAAEMSFAERVRHVRTTCGISETVDNIVPTVP